jgi:hypothetical protein
MRVLGIHGIGQTFEGAATEEAAWLPALQSGLEEAGSSRLDPSSFNVVGYGALFRPAEVRAGAVPPLDHRDVDVWEAEMLTALWAEAASLAELQRANATHDPRGEEPTIQGPDFQGRARTPAVVQRALRQLSKSRFFRGIGPERLLIFGMRQVRLFLHDPAVKAAVLERVVKKVSNETRIVIGHSLGSVVAYEALCAHPEWKVHTLITLGSPLGIQNLVFERLTPAPVNGVGAWPNVTRWVNIADRGDIVALVKALALQFGRVEDYLVYNGWSSHNAARYLTTREVGAAVAGGLAG